jgi:outer membrane receptor protein involved in Fe transport
VVEKLSAATPAAITVIEDRQIQRIPGINLDDRLRMVPGFSLFRRSSSLVAHPTTQGISLRGIGSTGASRSLVLWDGVPVNDPFGGWVYWTRIDPEEVSRIEVSRGASTSIFGDRAMGGAIALFSREPEMRRLSGSYEAGNRDTHIASLGYSHLFSKAAISGRGRAFTTDGYFIVPEASRGPVDTMAAVRFVAGDTRADFLGSNQRLFLKADVLVEDRRNGTVLQNNSTSLGNLAAHYWREISNDSISALAYHTREEFRSSFSAIAANRRTETLTMNQSVPAEAVGAAGYWRHTNSAWTSLLGGDFQRVEGSSIDSLVPTGKRIGEGSLFQRGYFAQGDITAGPAKLFLGARHHFASQGRQFFSPSAGVAAGRGRFRGRASAYRSFRAPTLNELYREFRAGTAVTQANALLKPERLFGIEAGLDIVGESNRLSFTTFRNSLKDIITNVTLSTSPSQIIRQRQNAAQAIARGFEAEFRQRWRAWNAEFAYLFVESRFSTRLRTPQIPKHQGSAQFTWHRNSTFAAFGVRSYASQFEDDLNRFLLPGYGTAHASIRQRLVKNLYAVAAFENLFDREYQVTFTTIPGIGPPRLWRAGLRWDGRLW